MAKTKEIVKFYRGLQEVCVNTYKQNDSLYKGSLFFCTDTQRIFYNGHFYGLGNTDLNGFATEQWVENQIKDTIVEVEQTNSQGSIIIEFITKEGNRPYNVLLTPAGESNSGLMSAFDYNKLAKFLDADEYALKSELSSNNFSDELKEKLEGIEEGAEVNKITQIRIDSNPLTIDVDGNERYVNIALTDKIKEVVGIQVGSVYVYKGTVASLSELENIAKKKGDVYNVTEDFDYNGKHYPAGTNIAWNDTEWDPLGGTVDLSPITNRLDTAESNINSHNTRLEALEEQVGTGSGDGSLSNRVELLETDMTTLKGDKEVSGSIKQQVASAIESANTYTNETINDALTWEELS